MNIVEMRTKADCLTLNSVLEEIKTECEDQIIYTNSASSESDTNWDTVRGESIKSLRRIREMVDTALAYAGAIEN